MEIKYFKLIATISQEGSLTKAADKLFLTQSALSHQLKEIEDQLRTKIFTRANKKLILTDSGKILLDSSSLILTEIDRVKKEINNKITGESGKIRLITECNTCYHWLPRILKSYQKEFPKVEVRINTNGMRRPVDLLLTGKIDVALLYRKVANKNIVYTELFTDDVVALVPADHHLAKKQFLTAQDFIDEDYITHSKRLVESVLYQNFLKPHNVTPKKVLYIHLTEAVLEMVKEGLGITVMAKWLVQPYMDSSIKMVKLSPTGLKRKWYLASLKDKNQPEFLISFIDLLKIGITAKFQKS